MKYVFDSPLVKTLSIICIVTSGLMMVPMFWPLPEVSAVDNNDVSAADLAEYLGESSIKMKEALERPLFHQNRRAAVAKLEVAKAEPVAVEVLFSLELVGVMGATEDSRTAYLLDTNTQETHTVRKDQVVDGWNVITVEVNSVVLTKDTEQKTLSLK